MRIQILILCLLLMALSNPSQAQFIGVKIGIPPGINTGTFNPATGGGGSTCPSNGMTFNGQIMTFNGQIMTFSGTP